MSVKRISIKDIDDGNSETMQRLTKTFVDRYGDILDHMADLSEKYGKPFVDIDPDDLDVEEQEIYKQIASFETWKS